MAGWLTPVPGGVGPMTVAMLMSNTIHCTRKQLKVHLNDNRHRKLDYRSLVIGPTVDCSPIPDFA